jgi:rubredoxin
MCEITLAWKCLVCGYVSNCSDEQCHDLPDKCPDCGAPKEEMEVIEED